MKLYTYWRSLATFRVRIALNLKGLSYEPVYVDLDAGDQLTPQFRAVNPQMAIPTLVEDDGNVLFQSLAILEYLNETHPEPPLLPADPRGRARVRALSLIAVADSHPLIVQRPCSIWRATRPRAPTCMAKALPWRISVSSATPSAIRSSKARSRPIRPSSALSNAA